MKKVVHTQDAPTAIGPFSQAIMANGWIFTSSQFPIDPVTGRMVTTDIKKQAIVILDNIKAILSAAGCSLENIVKTTIFLTNIEDFPTVNEVYAEYFEDSYPARTVIAVTALPKGAKIAIDVIATS